LVSYCEAINLDVETSISRENQHEVQQHIRIELDEEEEDREKNVIFDNDTCPLSVGFSMLCLSSELASAFCVM